MFQHNLDSIPFVCFAHRGARGYEPENTLLSFERAIELGSPWLELDIHRTEQELLVIHDSTLGRTTNGEGRLADVSVEFAQSLDAGKGQQIPTLRQVLSHVAGRAGINIEIKDPGAVKSLAELLASIKHEQAMEQFLVSSFDLGQLAEFRKLLPEIELGALYDFDDPAMVSKTLDLGASRLHISRDLVRAQLLDEAHRAGLKVYVFTLNEPQEIRKVIELGADGAFSDFPDRVLNIIHSMD